MQYLPESRYIHIETYSGLVPIVVWAHHVLGLTVRVDGNVDGEVSEVRFGSGFESVYIHTCHARPKASLLNETQDLLFQVSVSDEDLRLDSACRQTVLGYGIRCLELGQFKDDMIKGLAHAVVTSCISLVKSEASRRATIGAEYREKDFCPSVQRVLAVGRILFPNYDSMFDDLDLDSEQPCLALSEWTRETLPENLAHHWIIAPLKNCTLRLSHTLLVLSFVDNLDTCTMLPLDLYGVDKERYLPFRLPNAIEAFETMSLLLQGRGSSNNDTDTEKIAVVSAWGWSLCVSSIIGSDPGEMRPGFVVLQGVPMRTGERKRLIVDCGYPGINKHLLYTAIAEAGDEATLSSWTKPKRTRYFISVTDTAFEVVKLLDSDPVDGDKGSDGKAINIRIGFRGMQNLYWDSALLADCEHPAWLGQIVTLPQNTWIFRGLMGPGEMEGKKKQDLCQLTKSKEGTVHAALVAGDSSARWMLMQVFSGWQILNRKDRDSADEVVDSNEVSQSDMESRPYDSGFGSLSRKPIYPKPKPLRPTILVRSNGCCFQCAIVRAQSSRQSGHVGLVL